jgi:predicted nucleic-acid-binding Zn-ribbon protein
MNRTEVLTCSKCGGEMIQGSAETLYDSFGCTRPNPKKLEKRHGNKIQPYFCGNCGFIEFYVEKGAKHV